MGNFINPALFLEAAPRPAQPINPLAVAQQVGQVQALQQENQQRQGLAPLVQQQAAANVQSTQAEAQLKQQQLADQQAFANAMKDSGGNPDKLQALANQTISDPWMLARVDNMASEIRQRNSKISSDQAAQTASQHALYSGRLQSVIDATDPQLRAGLWKGIATDALAAKEPDGQPTFPAGVIDPNVPPDNATLQSIQTYLNGSNKYFLNLAQQKTAAAKAAEEQALADVSKRQAAREDIADQYQSVANPDQHQAWLDSIKQKYPDLYPEYSNLSYDPDNTPQLVENMAMNAAGRAKAQAAQTVADARQTAADAAMMRAKYSGGATGLATRVFDPTLSDADRASAQQAWDEFKSSRANGGATANAQLTQLRYLQKRADTDTKLHSQLQQQEQDQWTLAGRYGHVLKQANIPAGATDPDQLSQTVKDPKTGRDITASEAMQLMRASEAKAQELAKQSTQIRKREQWGEFAPKTQPPATAPASAPATAPPVIAAPPRQPASPATTTAAKTFPRAQLNAFATANRMTPDQAEAALKTRGYIVQ